MTDELHRRSLPGFAADLRSFVENVRWILGCADQPVVCDPAIFMEARSSDRLPTKSALFLPTAQLKPASSGVTVPSVSCPTMM